jgi:parallel beta helix pectate lyase-like protein
MGTLLRVSFLFISLLLALPAYAAQRTFVASSGNDANLCSATSPCRSFARALTQTDANGEVIVLDSAGYGVVTINQSVSIVAAAGVYAGVSVFATQDGVTVNGGNVVLRGLAINGQGGINGIRVVAGTEVHIEDCVISNLGGDGIRIEGGSNIHVSGTVLRSNNRGIFLASGTPQVFVSDTRIAENNVGIRVAAGSLTVNRVQMHNTGVPVLHVIPLASTSVRVAVRDSEFSDNSGSAVFVFAGNTGATADVTVERSSALGNASGFELNTNGVGSGTLILRQVLASQNTLSGVSSTGANGTVVVNDSAITRNGTGLTQASGGILRSCGNNMLVGNTAQTSGIITAAPACNQ